MPLKNLPTETARPLRNLIGCRPGEVASMALIPAADENTCETCMLLAFDAQEAISEESYPTDTLYYLIEGEAVIAHSSRNIPMQEGDVFSVPAHVQHAIHAESAIKLLQIGIR